jgi:putative ABC transport system substrate-binding protein
LPSLQPAVIPLGADQMAISIGRRQLIAVLGGAVVAWPLVARAQQRAIPLIGFLNPQSPDVFEDRLRGFRKGLTEIGYIEGENLAIVYRWADNQIERLPELAKELVHRQVAVIVTTGGSGPALAAKAATTSIPIVFAVAEDPVGLGLVSSLSRPDHNLTGINYFSNELTAKRLALLHELVPTAIRIAVLVDPTNAANAESIVKAVETAANAMGLQIRVLNTSTSRDIDAAFATFEHERPDALFVGNDQFFTSRRVQLANLASRYRLPAAFSAHEIAEAGGLMSYGTNIADAWRQVGVYSGRILGGAKPSDLPVVQSSYFKFVINQQTARILGLDLPQTLLVSADEVIE